MNSPDLQPYLRRKNELGLEGVCVLWGNRVVILARGRELALNILNGTHPGIGRIKSLACTYIWWPRIDQATEKCVTLCAQCQAPQKMLPAALLQPWEKSDLLWSRVPRTIPVKNVSTAYSKWLKIHATSMSTSAVTIELLRKTFANVGLPETIVSDNATNFTSNENLFEAQQYPIYLHHTIQPPSTGLLRELCRLPGTTRSVSLWDTTSALILHHSTHISCCVTIRAHVGEKTHITTRLVVPC